MYFWNCFRIRAVKIFYISSIVPRVTRKLPNPPGKNYFGLILFFSDTLELFSRNWWKIKLCRWNLCVPSEGSYFSIFEISWLLDLSSSKVFYPLWFSSLTPLRTNIPNYFLRKKFQNFHHDFSLIKFSNYKWKIHLVQHYKDFVIKP